VFGGTSAISGGGMWLPGNPLAATIEVDDSPEAAESYIRAITLGRTPEALITAYVHHAPKVFDFLTRETPIVLEVSRMPDYHGAMPGAANRGGRTLLPGLYDTTRLGEWGPLLRRGPRPGSVSPLHGDDEMYHGTVGPSSEVVQERLARGIVSCGGALVGSLMEACLNRGVNVVLGCPVRRLTIDGRRVTGVSVERSGEAEQIEARRGVMLATGGFEWSRELWDRLVGVPLDGPLSPPFNEGDGLRMAMQAGAMLGNVNQAWWRPSLAIPSEEYDGRPRLRSAHRGTLPGSIVVNRAGRRFANEALVYDDFGKAIVAFDPNSYTYPNHPCFLVFGQAYRDRYPRLLSHDAETPATPDWLHQAPTLHALAELIGVDATGLEAQVRGFDAYAERGVDPAFHRGETAIEWWNGDRRFNNPNLAPVGAGPYYAYELKSAVFGTKGGAVIDEHARVVGFDGQPIPGLFASGNVTAGIFGGSYPGGGGTLGPAVTFGYIAGRTAMR
jgi:succinate dehydrogenase/fumarate reductase flavoprotein subunit